MFKRVYWRPGLRPEILFYDNNCNLSKLTRNDPAFKGLGMPVDVFHFKCKHSITDEWCQQNCNPAMFPELVTEDGKWFFNSSIAEQTNVWLGHYHSICREMLVDRYRFFLDQMIMLKNQQTKKKLLKSGFSPSNWMAIELDELAELRELAELQEMN
jgi:hypothetical protein